MRRFNSLTGLGVSKKIPGEQQLPHAHKPIEFFTNEKQNTDFQREFVNSLGIYLSSKGRTAHSSNFQIRIFRALNPKKIHRNMFGVNRQRQKNAMRGKGNSIKTGSSRCILVVLENQFFPDRKGTHTEATNISVMFREHDPFVKTNFMLRPDTMDFASLKFDFY